MTKNMIAQKHKLRFFSLYLILLSAFLILSCSRQGNIQLGREAMAAKNWDKAVEYLIKAVSRQPQDVECRIVLTNALISASNEHLRRGVNLSKENRLQPALFELEKSLEFNPENNEARSRKMRILGKLREIEKQLREETRIENLQANAAEVVMLTPKIAYKKDKMSLEFNKADIKQVFKVIQKSSGIDVIFDEGFRSQPISLNLQEVSFPEVIERLMIKSKSFYKVLDSKTIMVIPDNPSKRREYEELVFKTFFLSYANPDEIKNILRELTGMKIISINKSLNSITVRGNPAEVDLVEKLIAVQDKPKGEMYIDIEIIEVNRSRAREYGIELNNYQVTGVYQPVVIGDAAAASATSSIRVNMIPYTDTSDYLLTLPAVNYKLLKSDSQSKIKARPQLRVVDREEVKVRLGDKVPIPTTSFVPYNTGGPNQQPITSYQMHDIGINITITPMMHHDSLITLKMEFELTFITSPGNVGLPPTIGNRAVNTIIRLRDSETGMLAGLLRDTERKAMRGFPLVSNIPILKEIFSGNKKEVEQTDIILTLTPRIIRFPDIEKKDREYIWGGTAERPGLMPPQPKLESINNETPPGEKK